MTTHAEPGSAVGWTLRSAGASGALAAGVAHIPVIEHHLYEAPYSGVLFVLLTVACFLLAQLLLSSGSTWVWLATAAVSALALAGYVVSRSSGLPQMEHDVGDWQNRLGAVAVTAELVMLVTAVLALSLRRR